MAGLLSVAERADLAAEMLAALPHTYSRVARVAATADDWNVETTTDGTAVLLVPCYYGTRSRTRRDEFGKITSHEPRFVIGPADPLKTGDSVSNIRDSAGAVILAGPLVVAEVEPQNDAGIPLARHARLEGANAALSAEVA